MKGIRAFRVAASAISAVSCASCTLADDKSAKPVVRQARMSEWSPNIERAEVASDRDATWKTVAFNSPAILNRLGSINIRPCDDVNVVVMAPDCSAPCTAPAAPPSLCISCTTGTLPQILGTPSADHWSANSAMVEEGVIG